MSNTARIAATAANTLTKPLNVEEVFSTYLYEGTNATQTITNGIDLSGEGGLVWIKDRDQVADHQLLDSEQGFRYILESNNTDARFDFGANIITPSSTGFSLSSSSRVNQLSQSFASWTFRKAPKFFDVVTWTGDGTTGRAISHNLGCEVGTIFVKATNANSNWYVYNRNLTSANYGLKLNGTDAEAFWGTGSVNSNTFSFDHQNGSGNTYVAYLFAHNNGDGDFGDGTQDIIKCGSYTGNGSTTGPEIDLGFEPQWIMIKNTSQSQDWEMYDVMRGWTSDGNADQRLEANNSNAEVTTGSSLLKPTATGFALTTTNSGLNASGNNYIYIAIRRGPMAVPESATDVFAIDTRSATNPSFTSNFVTDFALARDVSTTWEWVVAQRLTQGKIFEGTNDTDAEYSSTSFNFDYQDGYGNLGSANSNYYGWMWKRAPNYFDVVTYTGNGTAGRTVSHNLGVAPEMMIVKRRDGTGSWNVYHSSLGATKRISLQLTDAADTVASIWNNTGPTDSVFSVGTATGVNGSGADYIAYLFASVDGVSKVGSITGTGSDQTIDCGFSSGARFVLIKRTDSTGDWWLNDTERGIVVGNEPLLRLNLTQAEQNTNVIDPHSSGFIAKGSVFVSGGSYIFYAIA